MAALGGAQGRPGATAVAGVREIRVEFPNPRSQAPGASATLMLCLLGFKEYFFPRSFFILLDSSS